MKIVEEKVKTLKGEVLEDHGAMAKLKRQWMLEEARVFVTKRERSLAMMNRGMTTYPGYPRSRATLELMLRIANAHLKAVSSQNHVKDCMDEAWEAGNAEDVKEAEGEL